MITLAFAVPPALVAVQAKLAPVVSEVTFAASHPTLAVIIDSSSVTDHVTATSLIYQPPLPS
jgi:hypothetical protein